MGTLKRGLKRVILFFGLLIVQTLLALMGLQLRIKREDRDKRTKDEKGD